MMFLGAGASMASPTNLPGFDSLRDAILTGLGWDPTGDGTYIHPEPIGGREFPHLHSSRLSARSAPAEVVFGSLHRFGVPFAPQVERLVLDPRPHFNAVHAAAAAALGNGWPVWTPNIDMAVEDAHRALRCSDPQRVVVGERDGNGVRLDFSADAVADGVLLKLHGSADLTSSLAFIDLDLLAPYRQEEIERLAAAASGRRLVFYGYKGADTDLHSLLAACIQEAGEVLWYEPSGAAREAIVRTFGERVRFDPEHLAGREDSDQPANLAMTAERFVLQAERAKLLRTGDELGAKLAVFGRQRETCIRFEPQPPAIVQARLVERFGASGDEKAALAAARRADLLGRPRLLARPRAVRAHMHWAISASLYSSGWLGRVVGLAAAHPSLSAALPSTPRTFIFDKGPALLLRTGRYRRLDALAGRALSLPERRSPLRRGSDLYYRAHSLRYLGRPEAARYNVDHAASLLASRAGASDAERYAGVLLERGIIAIAQVRMSDAFAAANDLVNGAGRYAIGRWSGWGHWLWGMTWLYSLALAGSVSVEECMSDAENQFRLAEQDFNDSGLATGLGDVYIGRLLLYRLHRALSTESSAEPAPRELSRRQRQDQLLLLADLALAADDASHASACLDEVDRSHPSELTASWARFARAEIAHRYGNPGPSLNTIKADAEAVGAYFMAAQAALGVSGEAETTTSTGERVRAVGNPRVLWLLT